MLSSLVTTAKMRNISHKVCLLMRITKGSRLKSYPAFPSKPLHSVAVSDADASSALAFVAMKLNEGDVQTEFTQEQTACISRLGGRSSDLESV